MNVVEEILPGKLKSHSWSQTHGYPQELALDLPVVDRTSEAAVMSPRARRAYNFLRTSLLGGPALANVLVVEARALGLNRDDLKVAKKRLGAVAICERDPTTGRRICWRWSMPKSSSPIAYPTWRFHASKPACVVQNADEDADLGERWYDSPVKAQSESEHTADDDIVPRRSRNHHA